MQVFDIAVVIVMVLVALGLALFVRLVSIITNVSGTCRRWRSSSPVPASGAANG